MTNRQDSPQAETRSFGAQAAVLALIFLLLALLYPLSIGPFIWLDSKGYIQVTENSLIARFYWPLIWAAEQSSFTSSIFYWYAELWGR